MYYVIHEMSRVLTLNSFCERLFIKRHYVKLPSFGDQDVNFLLQFSSILSFFFL